MPKLVRFVVAIVIAALPLVVVAAGDGLQPCNASLLSDDGFNARLASSFLRGICIDYAKSVSVLQALVQPSFEDEWLVSIYEKRDHSYELELVLLNESLWHANQEETPILGTNMGVITLSGEARMVPSRCYKKPIAHSLVIDLQKLWQYQILSARYSSDVDLRVDGITYTFAVQHAGLGTATACSTSPEAGNGAYDLVLASQLLCDLAIARDQTAAASYELQLWKIAQKHDNP